MKPLLSNAMTKLIFIIFSGFLVIILTSFEVHSKNVFGNYEPFLINMEEDLGIRIDLPSF